MLGKGAGVIGAPGVAGVARLALAALTLAVPPAGAGPLYFGGGNSQLAMRSNAGRIGNQDPSGYVLSFGREYRGTWAVDLGTAFGHHLDVVGDSPAATRTRFDAAWLALRKRFWWLPEYGLAPWLGGGAGYYRIRAAGDDFRLTGRGGFLTAGVDVSLQGPWMVRAQVTRHWSPLRDDSGGGPFTTTLREYSASVIYRFGLH